MIKLICRSSFLVEFLFMSLIYLLYTWTIILFYLYAYHIFIAYTTLNQNLSIAVLHCTSLFSLSLTLLFVSFFQLPMLPLCFTPCLFILFWPYHILLNICFLFSNFLVLFNLWGDNEIQKQNLRIISKIKLHNFNYKTV